MAQPLMPHATAAWLVDNTALTFEQIAHFCGLHILEIQAIADETSGTKLMGRDPVRAGEVTMAEIEKGQADPNHELVMVKAPEAPTRTKGPRYTPVSKRQDKPDGIAWIIRNHRKLLVVDSQHALITGWCHSARWRGQATSVGGTAVPWRDTGVQIAGPVAAEAECAFAQTWAIAGGQRWVCADANFERKAEADEVSKRQKEGRELKIRDKWYLMECSNG